MSDHSPLHSLDQALETIGKEIVHTDKGSFVRVDRLKEVMRSNGEASLIGAAMAPRPKTFAEARRMVYQDEELMELFDHSPKAPGASVPAMESQPPSRA